MIADSGLRHPLAHSSCLWSDGGLQVRQHLIFNNDLKCYFKKCNKTEPESDTILPQNWKIVTFWVIYYIFFIFLHFLVSFQDQHSCDIINQLKHLVFYLFFFLLLHIRLLHFASMLHVRFEQDARTLVIHGPSFYHHKCPLILILPTTLFCRVFAVVETWWCKMMISVENRPAPMKGWTKIVFKFTW